LRRGSTPETRISAAADAERVAICGLWPANRYT
jgi:hypothetical protein